MEIYLQEVASTTYLNQISESSKQKMVFKLEFVFRAALVKDAIHFHACRIRANTWNFFWRQQQ